MLFLKRFGPATIGSAGTQIALFADTIIASFLATGALSALYYADRLNQLPIGVIGIAAGTVLLPEMARRITAGDEAGAQPFAEPRHRADAAAFGALPRRVPDRAGTDHARRCSSAAPSPRPTPTPPAMTLMAYAIGLLPFVLMRSVDGDVPGARRHRDAGQGAVRRRWRSTCALKILLMDRYAQVGLAFATSVGAWINLLLLAWFAVRAELPASSIARLRQSLVKLASPARRSAAAF